MEARPLDISNQMWNRNDLHVSNYQEQFARCQRIYSRDLLCFRGMGWNHQTTPRCGSQTGYPYWRNLYQEQFARCQRIYSRDLLCFRGMGWGPMEPLDQITDRRRRLGQTHPALRCPLPTTGNLPSSYPCGPGTLSLIGNVESGSWPPPSLPQWPCRSSSRPNSCQNSTPWLKFLRNLPDCTNISNGKEIMTDGPELYSARTTQGIRFTSFRGMGLRMGLALLSGYGPPTSQTGYPYWRNLYQEQFARCQRIYSRDLLCFRGMGWNHQPPKQAIPIGGTFRSNH